MAARTNPLDAKELTMTTKNSCAMLMLAMVAAVSLSATAMAQEVSRPGNWYSKAAVRRTQSPRRTTGFLVPRASALNGRGTKTFKQRKIGVNRTRFVYPNQKVNLKGRVPMIFRQYGKQGFRRRINLSELRKRLYALENNNQSRARKTGDKPTPQNNSELESICDQLRTLMRQINMEMEYAYLTSGREAEAAELQMLYNRARRVAKRIGCGGIYLILKPQMQVMEGQFKVFK